MKYPYHVRLKEFRQKILFWILRILYDFFILFLPKNVKIEELPKKILLVNILKIGDTIVSTPTVRAIRKRYNDSDVRILCNANVVELWKDNPDINGIFVYKGIRSLDEPRTFKADLTIVLSMEFKSNMVAFLCKGKYRLGYNHINKGFLLHEKIPAPYYTGRPVWEYNGDVSIRHSVEILLNLAGLLGADISDKKPKIYLNKDIRQKVAQYIPERRSPETFRICMHPWKDQGNYLWGNDRFSELAARIRERCDIDYFITGGSEDRGTSEQLATLINPKPIVLAGRLSLLETAAFLEDVDLVISVDTGITHMASAIGVPVIALFGPGSPKVWAPYEGNNIIIQKDSDCYGCRLPYCFRETHICMDAITVEDVFSAAEKFLTQHNKIMV